MDSDILEEIAEHKNIVGAKVSDIELNRAPSRS